MRMCTWTTMIRPCYDIIWLWCRFGKVSNLLFSFPWIMSYPFASVEYFSLVISESVIFWLPTYVFYIGVVLQAWLEGCKDQESYMRKLACFSGAIVGCLWGYDQWAMWRKYYVGLVNQYDYICMRTFIHFNWSLKLPCEWLYKNYYHLPVFKLFWRRYTLGHTGLTFLCKNSPSPGVWELNVKIIHVCLTMLFVHVRGAKKKHESKEVMWMFCFFKRKAYAKTRVFPT